MKEVYIEDDILCLVDNDSVEYAEGTFETENEVEVRIPFHGYYSLKVQCKDLQMAMLEVLRCVELVGITSIEGVETVIETVEEDETHCVTK